MITKITTTAARLLAFVLAAATTVSAQQQMRFEDVVRNLRNPDARTRLAAVRLLRDAKYPEAIEPLAPLVLDPMDDVQLEAIGAELSFFLDQDVRTKKMVGFVIEKRVSGIAPAAFDLGPLAVWPRPVPRELLDSLLQAVDDENAGVRLEAIYAFGIVARAPLSPEQQGRLIKALDHYDPAIRSGAARVIERQKLPGMGDALIKATNDSHPEVRFAAMRALGAVREERALTALTEQLAYYKKGEGAWSALDALAHLASPASVPVFRERLQDKDPFIRRAAVEGLGRTADTSQIDAIEKMVSTDDSAMVRLASAFAMQKLRGNYIGRAVDLIVSPKVIPQAEQYLVELGPGVVSTLVPRLQDSDPDVREALANVLGAVGDASVLPALEAASKDADASVAAAAKRAIARIHPS